MTSHFGKNNNHEIRDAHKHSSGYYSHHSSYSGCARRCQHFDRLQTPMLKHNFHQNFRKWRTLVVRQSARPRWSRVLRYNIIRTIARLYLYFKIFCWNAGSKYVWESSNDHATVDGLYPHSSKASSLMSRYWILCWQHQTMDAGQSIVCILWRDCFIKYFRYLLTRRQEQYWYSCSPLADPDHWGRFGGIFWGRFLGYFEESFFVGGFLGRFLG